MGWEDPLEKGTHSSYLAWRIAGRLQSMGRKESDITATFTSLVTQVKNPPADAGDTGLISGSGRSPGGGNGKPTPVFLPGKSHEQSAWGLQSMGSQKVECDRSNLAYEGS